MHELSIVQSIVETAEEEVAKLDAKIVSRIELDIGNMSGVEFDSFDFAWEPITKNTVLEHAERVINRIPAIANCDECGHEFEKLEPYDACPKCNSFIHSLKSGKEMKIKSLVIS